MTPADVAMFVAFLRAWLQQGRAVLVARQAAQHAMRSMRRC